VTGRGLRPGVITVLQTFGDRINLHVHLHFLVTEGGVDVAGVFHKIPGIDDTRLEEIFAREVLRLLVGRKLLSPEWAEKILAWLHSGFNVHSLVRAKTKPEAERIGKYMLRPILALERLTILEGEGKVGDRHGEKGAELETMDCLEFIARVTSHIPDKGRVTVLRPVRQRPPGKSPKGELGGIAFLTEHTVVDKIMDHLKLSAENPPPAGASRDLDMVADPPAEYFS